MSMDKPLQAGRLLILPPRLIDPPLVWPKWKAPIGSRREAPDQPHAWPGMQVLVAGIASAGFIAKAAERTAPDGKVVVISPDGEATRRLTPLGFDHMVLETSSPGQAALPDHSIDRAFLVMGLRKMPSLGRTLEEIHRVIQPEGQLVVHRRFLFARLLPRQQLVSSCVDLSLDLVASHAALFHHTLTFEQRHHENLDPT